MLSPSVCFYLVVIIHFYLQILLHPEIFSYHDSDLVQLKQYIIDTVELSTTVLNSIDTVFSEENYNVTNNETIPFSPPQTKEFPSVPFSFNSDGDSIKSSSSHLFFVPKTVSESQTEGSVVSSLNDTDVNQSHPTHIVSMVVHTKENDDRSLIKNNRGKSRLVQNSEIGSTVSTHRRHLPSNPSIRSREKLLRKKHPQWFGDVEPKHQHQGKCPNCRICVGSSPCVTYRTQQEDWNDPERQVFNVTMVMASSVDRIPFLSTFKELWSGPLCVAIVVKENSLSTIEQSIVDLKLPSYYTVILYVIKQRSEYNTFFPINLLRNVAIRAIRTSHFLVMDMDMRPSDGLFKELNYLPKKLRDDNKAAVIVPSVFLRKKDTILRKCSSLSSCDRLSMQYVPRTKQKLLSCYKSGDCTFVKGSAKSHLYVTKEWIQSKKSEVFQLVCFPSRFQEPYIMVKYTNKTILFDERFVNYGCNKVQFVDHLRFLGYSFYIPSTVFVTDIVHQPSSFRSVFDNKYSPYSRPDMTIVCFRYLEQLAEKYGSRKDVLTICPNKQFVTYSVY